MARPVPVEPMRVHERWQTVRHVLTVLGLVLAVAILGAGMWLYTPDKPRAVLEAIYATPPSQFIDVDGVRLHVRDTGPRDAPAIVLLHGFGSSLQTWDGWAADLGRDFRVVRYDLPGFGLTGADPSGVYTDERSIAVLAGLMNRLGLTRATIVGNSMGGRIAWRFAAAMPDRIDRLVLVSPDGFAGPGRTYGATASVPPLLRLLPYVLPGGMLRASLRPAYADPARLTEATYVRTRDMLLAPGVRRAIVDISGQLTLVDPVPLLTRITVPTLLLWGERDAMIPFANGADYLRALPHATLHALPGLGHVPQEEAPETAAIVRAFLTE